MAYNTPAVTLATARRTAHAYLQAGIIPCLVSPPGVGKTSLARQIAMDMNAALRPIRLNNIAPEDASGLQYIDRNAQRSIHLPPRWVPNPDGSDGPVLVFIDEITQAPDENRKAIMSALLERYLGDVALPDNCHFIAAGNSSDDGTNVYEFDRATADRFGFILIRTDVEGWCNDWAPQNDVDLCVVAFLRVRPDAFEMSEELMKGDDVIGPSPRSWAAVSRFLNAAKHLGLSRDEIRAGVMGKLGLQVGEAFLSVYDQVQQLKSIKDLLGMSKAERRKHTPRTLDALWTYGQGMIWHATSIDRMAEVFEILESFEQIDDVPFYEVRFNIAETMLSRGRLIHNLGDGMYKDQRLAGLMIKWREEMNGIGEAVPDGRGLDAVRAAA